MASYPSQIAKITDHLYLSSFVGASEFNVIKYNITCVITVCREVPKCILKNVESIKLEVVDRPTETLSKYFDMLADKIHEVASRNSACLVHCVAGISRSATIVLAYLMKHLRMSLREAHAMVKSKRPLIRPNLGFWRQLIDYEKSLFGKNSISIVPTKIGFVPDIYENEIRSMIFVRNNNSSFTDISLNDPIVNSNSNSTNTSPMTLPTLPENQFASNSKTQFSFQPIVGNGGPKYAAQNAALKSNIMTTEVAVDTMATKLNKTHYTTTYRSSYQRP